MDHEKMAQDLATAFAVSQQVVDTERPQIQLQKMLEDYVKDINNYWTHGFGSLQMTPENCENANTTSKKFPQHLLYLGSTQQPSCAFLR